MKIIEIEIENSLGTNEFDPDFDSDFDPEKDRPGTRKAYVTDIG